MSVKKLSAELRTWVEINRAAAIHNVKQMRRLLGAQTKLWSVVKSNAYGHGLYTFPRIVAKAGVDGFCVDSLVEAIRLRENNISHPMLVLGPTLPSLLSRARVHDVAVTISSKESLKAITNHKLPPEFHLKFDTGMHRQGFSLDEVGVVIGIINKGSPVWRRRFKGVYTHFASASNPKSKFIKNQNKAFEEIRREFLKNKLTPTFHASASSGVILGPEYHYDMVRIGMALMGNFPSTEIESHAKDIDLKPVLSWKTVITETKWVERGEGIGYDMTEILRRKTKVAILPVGYWHGLPRSVSSLAYVLVQGKRCKILGRVSMDMAAVDVTDADGRVGDEVVLIGKSGGGIIKAEELAAKANTTHYEIVTRLNPLMERIET